MEITEENKKLAARLEALLFIYGDPVTIKKIASVLDLDETAVQEGLQILREHLRDTARGLMILEKENRVQLVTKPDFAKFLEDIVKDEFTESLTPAALETLSIISYTAPITRAEIDYIRGVNSSFILRSLTLRGLVERSLDKKHGHAYTYRPSFELLKHLGIRAAEELPDFDKFQDLMKQFNERPEDKKESDPVTVGSGEAELKEQENKSDE